jgi:hypothetical protein
MAQFDLDRVRRACRMRLCQGRRVWRCRRLRDLAAGCGPALDLLRPDLGTASSGARCRAARLGRCQTFSPSYGSTALARRWRSTKVRSARRCCIAWVRVTRSSRSSRWVMLRSGWRRRGRAWGGLARRRLVVGRVERCSSLTTRTPLRRRRLMLARPRRRTWVRNMAGVSAGSSIPSATSGRSASREDRGRRVESRVRRPRASMSRSGRRRVGSGRRWLGGVGWCCRPGGSGRLRRSGRSAAGLVAIRADPGVAGKPDQADAA